MSYLEGLAFHSTCSLVQTICLSVVLCNSCTVEKFIVFISTTYMLPTKSSNSFTCINILLKFT